MSKFQELCDAFDRARERALSARVECSEFAGRILTDLLKDLE
jgi:hypothetical protein